jgi:hypothetical protein
VAAQPRTALNMEDHMMMPLAGFLNLSTMNWIIIIALLVVVVVLTIIKKKQQQ